MTSTDVLLSERAISEMEPYSKAIGIYDQAFTLQEQLITLSSSSQ